MLIYHPIKLSCYRAYSVEREVRLLIFAMLPSIDEGIITWKVRAVNTSLPFCQVWL